MFNKLFALTPLLFALLVACTPSSRSDFNLSPTTNDFATPLPEVTAIIEPTAAPTAKPTLSYEAEPPSFQVQTITDEWVDGYFGWYGWGDVFVTTEFFDHKGPFQLNEEGIVMIDIASQRPLSSVSIRLIELEGDNHANVEIENPQFPLTLEQHIDENLYQLTIVGYWANGDEVASGFTITTSSEIE